MIAFVKVSDVLIKAYEHPEDWQTIDSNGVERWRSKWSSDVKRSLQVALNRHAIECGYTGVSIVDQIEYVGVI